MFGDGHSCRPRGPRLFSYCRDCRHNLADDGVLVMRFNGKELAALAMQPSHKFDKEGALVVRERQEGLFRRSEVSFERWCRLRGNMLFYFKSRDQYSEPAGVIVLEQCEAQLDASSDEGPFSFSIVFSDDVRSVQFCASSASERDAWIQALHMASYEYMRSQLRALSDKLDEKNRTSNGGDSEQEAKVNADFTEGPYLDMSLACDNLMCDGDGQPPNPIVLVSLLCTERAQWRTYARTEFIERSSNPCFLTTINFRLCDLRCANTKMKLSVYDVRERLTSTMTLLGSALFSLDDLNSSDRNSFRLTLASGSGGSVGFITITARHITAESSESTDSSTVESSAVPTGITESSGGTTRELHDRCRREVPSSVSQHQQDQPKTQLSVPSSSPGNLNVLFENVLSQSYRFHTGLGADLSVQEIMAESRLCFIFPQKVIRLFIQEEKQLLHFLAGMSELKDEWREKQTDLIERHLHLVNIYTAALTNLDSYSGSSFKPSCEKNSPELEFVPVNLHLQRITVHDDSVKKSGTYNVFTVGAFAAHARRFKHGGLHRILGQMKPSRDDKANRAAFAAEAVARIEQLKASLENLTDELLRLAGHQDSPGMCAIMTEISTKAHHLIGICDPSLVEEACALLDSMSSPKKAEVVKSETAAQQREGSAANDPSKKTHSKERSKSLDAHQLSTMLGMQVNSSDGQSQSSCNTNDSGGDHGNVLQITATTTTTTSCSLKSDYKREFGSPRSGRRRVPGLAVTRHGSLKEDGNNHRNQQQQQQLQFHNLHNYLHPKTLSKSSEPSRLVLTNNAKNDGVTSTKRTCPDDPEPWDLTQLNIEASIMCMASKVKGLSRGAGDTGDVMPPPPVSTDWVLELRPSVRKLTQALECLWHTANLTHVTYLLVEPVPASIQHVVYQHRRDVVFTNMLTTMVTALLTRFWCQRIDAHQMTRIAKIGVLAQFEGLLSCHGDEMGMLEDMMVAIDDLARIVFRLEPIGATQVAVPPMPMIEGNRFLMTVKLPVPDVALSALSTADAASGFAFHVTPVFFNVGINEQATIAERETCNPSCMQSVPLSARNSITCMHSANPNPAGRFGDVSLQDKINSDGLKQLREFHDKYRQVPVAVAAANRARRPSVCEPAAVASVTELLDQLTNHVLHSRKAKSVEILHIAAQICRLMNGLRFTSCKSAKDRTSMSVTLEQCFVLQEQFDLAEHEFVRALECMRCEGTRRENTLKNAGVKKYAFNALQIMALPKLYRPPTGTYGNVQT